MIKPTKQIFLPCCGVFAMFLASQVEEFDQAFEVAKKGLKKTDRWKGRMYWREVLGLLDLVGVKHMPAGYGNKHIGVTLELAISENDFADGAQYIVAISGHFLTVKGEFCYDQANPHGRHITAYKHRRCIVKGWTKILEKS